MICKYLTSNLSLKKKKSSIYFILFPTLITVAHILAQKQTSIYVCTYFVYKHSRITKEKKQVMVHFCVDFCLNLSDKQIFFDFTIALSIWELIKIFISNLLIIALNHRFYTFRDCRMWNKFCWNIAFCIPLSVLFFKLMKFHVYFKMLNKSRRD